MTTVENLAKIHICPKCGSRRLVYGYNPQSNRAYAYCERCGEQLMEPEATAADNVEDIEGDIRFLWMLLEAVSRTGANTEFETTMKAAIESILRHLIAKEQGE